MKLNYQSIKKLLNGEVCGAGTLDDGTHVLLQAERIEDWRANTSYTGPLEAPELVYTARWESKRTDRGIWYVTHTYHEDGTVEETFEHEELAS